MRQQLVELIDEMLLVQGEKIAMVQSERQLSYQQLGYAVEHLSQQLEQRFSADIPAIIPLVCDRSIEFVVAALACWKLGAAYLPLAADTPSQRVEFILQDCQCDFILMPQNTRFALDQLTIHHWQLQMTPVTSQTRTNDNTDGLAYVIYTSGTTGTPKGCAVGFESLSPIVAAFVAHFAITSDSQLTGVANIAFDAAVLEIWPALSTGATLHLVPQSVLLNPRLLVDFYRDHQITFSWLPTPLAEALMSEAELQLPACLNTLQTAGQRLTVRPPKHWQVRVENSYGPTETTVIASSSRVTADGPSLPDIGEPLPGVTCTIVDSLLNPVPVGEPGELYISGIGVARGYIHRAALNQQKFVQLSFDKGPKQRAYATGDICKLNAEGKLVYLERADDQLKLHGYRIEIGEIEYQLAKHQAIVQCLVMCQQVAGQAVLVAYFSTRQAVDEQTLKSYLALFLPAYMIPTFFVALAHWPLTANGKVDKTALPAVPQTSQHNVIEQTLSQPMQRFLQLMNQYTVGSLAWQGDFFAAGGTSISLIRLISKVYRDFAIVMPAQLLFEQRTPAAVWQNLEQQRYASIVIEPRATAFKTQAPLFSSQRSVWYLANLAPDDRAYHAKASVRFKGVINPEQLQQALQHVVDQHEIYRTTFELVNGEPQQVIHPHWSLALLRFDVSHERQNSEPALQRLIRDTLNQPFELAKLPLVRWALVKVADDEQVLIHIEHHLVHDGWSYNLFLAQLFAAYRALDANQPLADDKPAQFADLCLTQQQWLSSESAQQQRNYWGEQLAGSAQMIHLPYEPTASVNSVDVKAGKTIRQHMPRQTWQRIQQLAESRSETAFSIIYAVFALVLGRYSGDRDINIGSAFANRNWTRADELIGMVINTVVLRSRQSVGMSTDAWLKQTFNTTAAAQANQQLPFEQVVELVNPAHQQQVNPLFQVFLGFHDSPMPSMDLPGVEHIQLLEAIDSDAAKFDLSVVVIPRHGQEGEADPVHVLWEFKRGKLSEWLIAQMMACFDQTLTAVLADQSGLLAQLAVPSADAEPLLSGRQRPASGTTVVSQFIAMAAQTPNKMAVAVVQNSLSYGQLLTQVQDKAGVLATKGVGRGSRVCVCVARDMDMVIWLLAVQYAGACYVPLDPDYPPARLAYIAEQSQCQYIISDSRDDEFLNTANICQFQTSAMALALPLKVPIGVSSGDPMYVIYTSGSTGKPKGVVISHGAFANFIHSMANTFALTEQDNWLAVTSCAFDISTLELYLPLLSGASLWLADNQQSQDPRLLAQLLNTARASYFQATPTTWQMLCESGWRAEQRLTGLCGGEALSRQLADGIIDSGVELFNMYGPTETTVWSALKPLSSKAVPVTLGKPIDNTDFYLLDEQGLAVPPGAIGRLWIAGDSLASGYLFAPELSEQAFVLSPGGVRRYHSGDLAALDQHGELRFHGRIDHQVKLNGFRIELGEIEAVLRQCGPVKEALVIIRQVNNQPLLLAYVIADLAVRQLILDHCLDFLPDYMQPNALYCMAAFPRTPNEKLDRNALPLPQRTARQVIAEPQSDTHKRLASVYEQILNLQQVDIDASFFQLGGRSLLAMRVLTLIEQTLHVRLSLADFMAKRTIRRIAQFIDEQASDDELSTTAPLLLASEKAQGQAISLLQRPLYSSYLISPKPQVYNVQSVYRLTGSIVVERLVAAIKQVYRQNDVLHCQIVSSDEQVLLRKAFDQHWSVAVVTDINEQDEQAILAHWVAVEQQHWFDLAQGAVFNARLLCVSPQCHYLQLNLPHIVIDGWSMDLLFKQLLAGYQQMNQQMNPQMSAVPAKADFIDLLARQDERRTANDNNTDFWCDYLKGYQPLQLEPDGGGIKGQPHFYHGTLSSLVGENIRQLAERYQISPFSLVFSLFSYLIAAKTDRAEVVISTPYASRGQADEASVLGYMVSMLPVLSCFPLADSVGESLKASQKQLYQLFDRAEFDMAAVLTNLKLNLSAAQGGDPLQQVVFAWQDGLLNAASSQHFGEAQVERLVVPPQGNKFALMLLVYPQGSDYQLHWEFSPELFSVQAIADLQAQLAHLVNQLTQSDDAVWAAIRWDCGEPLLPLPKIEETVVSCFAQMVGRYPDAMALVDDNRSLTYAELEQHSRAIAAHLVGIGLNMTEKVGICLSGAMDAAIAALAVIRAGGVYVPLAADLALSQRISHSCQMRWVVAHSGYALDGVATICLNQINSTGSAAMLPSIANDAPIYVNFSSGSTGQPKGIVCTHRGVVRLVKGASFADLSHDTSLLCAAPMTFDAYTFELWGALLNGGKVVFADTPVMNCDRLSWAINHQGVNCAWLTSALFNTLVDIDVTAFNGLTQLLVGGDIVSGHHVKRLYQHNADITIINGYGPTENTTFTACYPIERDFLWSQPLPLGYPVSGTEVVVINQQRQRLPAGFIGEIAALGHGLAEGYLGQPDLTEQVFIPLSLADKAAPQRAYLTGDKGYFDSQGRLRFLGRGDSQLKVNGFRIESEAVNYILCQSPWVVAAQTLAIKTAEAQLLVAFVQLMPQSADHWRSELLPLLAEHLPVYMHPGAFVEVSQMPLTDNGKLDRNTLYRYYQAYQQRDSGSGQLSPMGRILGDIWQSVLAVNVVDANANFFYLGGNSLLCLKVQRLIAQQLALDVSLNDLISNAQLGDLSAKLTAIKANQNPAMAITCITEEEKRQGIALSVQQASLWFIYRAERDASLYNVSATWQLCGELDVARLRRALVRLYQRYDVLHCRFFEVDGQGFIASAPQDSWQAQWVDLAAQNETIEQWIEHEQRRQFDLLQPPLFIARVLRAEPQRHYVQFNLPHIIIDGVSIDLLWSSLVTLYQTPEVLADEEPASADYLDYLPRAAQTPLCNDYWLHQLATVRPLILNKAQPGLAQNQRTAISADHSRAITELARAWQISEFSLCLSVFALVLAGHTGQSRFAISTPYANRDIGDSGDIAGYFVAMLPIKFVLSAEDDLAQIGQKTHQRVLEGMKQAHFDLTSFADLQQVVFAWQQGLSSALPSTLSFADIKVDLLRGKVEPAKFPLMLTMLSTDEAEPTDLHWQSNSSGPQPGMLAHLHQRFVTLLMQLDQDNPMLLADYAPDLDYCVVAETPYWLTLEDEPITTDWQQIELLVKQAWESVLTTTIASRQANFFRLGGNSLLILKVQALLQQSLQRRVSINTMMAYAVLAELAEALAMTTEVDELSEINASTHISTDAFTLSAEQQRLWLMHQYDPSSAYNIPLLIDLPSSIDAATVEQAVRQVLMAYPILRMRFIEQDGLVLQQPEPLTAWSLPQQSLAADGLAARLADESERVFDLAQGMACYICLLQLDEADGIEHHQTLLFNIHHCCFDGGSLAEFIRALDQGLDKELAQTLTEQSVGPNGHFQTFIQWQQSTEYQTLLAEDIDYWTKRLSGHHTNSRLPADLISSAQTQRLSKRLIYPIEPLRVEAVQRQARYYGVSEFTFWYCVLHITVARVSQQSDLSIATPVANRVKPEFSQMIGFFANTLLLQHNLDESVSFAAMLGQVQATISQDLAHQSMPLNQLVEILQLELTGAEMPLSQLLFSLSRHSELPLAGQAANIHSGYNQQPKYALSLTVSISPQQCQWQVEYDASQYSEGLIGSFVTAMAQVLAQVSDDPRQPIGALSLVGNDASRGHIRRNSQRSRQRNRQAPSILDAIATQVAKQPNALALMSEQAKLSYQELYQQAQTIAAALQHQGLTAQSRVAVMMHRTEDLPVTLLGILLAGGVYVPLDPEYPKLRSHYILKDAQPHLVVVNDIDLAAQIPDDIAVTTLQTLLSQDRDEPLRAVSCKPDDLAYIIYTSGSTGQPKGVAIRYEGLAYLRLWASETYRQDDLALVYAATSVCFDLSIFELFVTWGLGGCTYFSQNLYCLVDDVDELAITLINTVPSVLSTVLEYSALPDSLKVLNLAGEPLPLSLAKTLAQQRADIRCFNLYGPSECTTYSTAYPLNWQNLTRLLIGRAIAGTELYVMDNQGRHLPDYFAGELVIGGRGVAQGYWQKPALSRECFGNDSFIGRYYKTSDRVRRVEGGELAFVGRLDEQVKLNGFRIEPAEIDHCLLSMSTVIQACTVVVTTSMQQRQLCSFVHCDKADFDEPQLLQQLAEQLPAYMIPSKLIRLDKMPLTASGKLDKKCLAQEFK